ncbi:MAG: hypothetical protein C0506_14450 [Anaerolinea sp.]|nr:hypothetical protein [Anaerolinea sp.]
MVDVLVRGDVSAFNSLLDELPEPCATNPSGVGSPPPCPTGVPDGGTINTFRYISCERGYPGEQQREVTERILKQKRKLYAVFQPQPVTLFTLIPKGEYSLIFISETAQGEQLGERYEVRGGRLVGMWLACGPGLDTVRRMAEDVANWIVPPQVALPTPTPIPPTPAAGPDGYPLNRRTGMVPGPDIVLDALESRDPLRIQAHFTFYPIGCVTSPTGFPQPPFCEANQPSGTPVQVFPVLGCEGSFQTREQAIPAARELADTSIRIWAIYQQTPRTPQAVYEFPLGSQVVVLNRPGGFPSGQGLALQVEGGNILSVWFGCGTSAAEMVEDVAASQLLLAPPR